MDIVRPVGLGIALAVVFGALAAYDIAHRGSATGAGSWAGLAVEVSVSLGLWWAATSARGPRALRLVCAAMGLLLMLAVVERPPAGPQGIPINVGEIVSIAIEVLIATAGAWVAFTSAGRRRE